MGVCVISLEVYSMSSELASYHCYVAILVSLRSPAAWRVVCLLLVSIDSGNRHHRERGLPVASSSTACLFSSFSSSSFLSLQPPSNEEEQGRRVLH